MRQRSAVATLSEDRDGFKFRSGHVALDLAATLAARHKSAPRELLSTAADLDRWLGASRLVTSPIAVAQEADLGAARALREAIYRSALACLAGRPFRGSDRALLNEWTGRPLPTLRLGSAPGMAGRSPAPTAVSSALAAIARAAVELLSGSDSARIRNCAGCSILFVDASRAGRRRWCSMAACGNKDKVAAHRRRIADERGPTLRAGPSSARKRGTRKGIRR